MTSVILRNMRTVIVPCAGAVIMSCFILPKVVIDKEASRKTPLNN